jgi:hypothetical protein
LTIGENGIMEEEFQSLYDYTPDEMFEYGWAWSEILKLRATSCMSISDDTVKDDVL